MPYITQAQRDLLDAGWLPDSPGELNYVITRTLMEYVRHKGIRYSTINETVGVLECAKLEFYRRVAAGYEDMKIEENGDVY